MKFTNEGCNSIIRDEIRKLIHAFLIGGRFKEGRFIKLSHPIKENTSIYK
jgi:hypothetical protein